MNSDEGNILIRCESERRIETLIEDAKCRGTMGDFAGSLAGNCDYHRQVQKRSSISWLYLSEVTRIPNFKLAVKYVFDALLIEDFDYEEFTNF